MIQYKNITFIFKLNMLFLFIFIFFSYNAISITLRYNTNDNNFVKNNTQCFQVYKYNHFMQFYLKKLIIKMLNNIEIPYEQRILFINKIYNYTNHTLNTKKMYKLIKSTIKDHLNNFTLINKKKIDLLKIKLKLSSKDHLFSKNKTIFIAKQMGIKYLLFSQISGNLDSTIIYLELVKTDTYEIIWKDIKYLKIKSEKIKKLF